MACCTLLSFQQEIVQVVLSDQTDRSFQEFEFDERSYQVGNEADAEVHPLVKRDDVRH